MDKIRIVCMLSLIIVGIIGYFRICKSYYRPIFVKNKTSSPIYIKANWEEVNSSLLYGKLIQIEIPAGKTVALKDIGLEAE